MTRTLTPLQRAAYDAMACQDACNLSGVSHSYLEAVNLLREMHARREITQYHSHPILTLFLSKLNSLNRCECLCEHCTDAFKHAWDECRKIAGESPTDAERLTVATALINRLAPDDGSSLDELSSDELLKLEEDVEAFKRGGPPRE